MSVVVAVGSKWSATLLSLSSTHSVSTPSPSSVPQPVVALTSRQPQRNRGIARQYSPSPSSLPLPVCNDGKETCKVARESEREGCAGATGALEHVESMPAHPRPPPCSLAPSPWWGLSTDTLVFVFMPVWPVGVIWCVTAFGSRVHSGLLHNAMERTAPWRGETIPLLVVHPPPPSPTFPVRPRLSSASLCVSIRLLSPPPPVFSASHLGDHGICVLDTHTRTHICSSFSSEGE